LSAAQPERIFFFLALRFGDDNDRAKPQRVADQSKTNSGVARGAFDDHAAWLELSPFHGVLNDEQRGPVLDRLTRVHEFGFAQNRTAGGSRGALQLD
jgi:hypothetical protein